MVTGRRILVADDDADMRRFLCCTLRRAGYRVAAVGDVMDAIELLASPALRARDPIRAIVSDVRMPGLSGLDFLALLRAANVDVPVVLVSAFHDEATRAEARSLGAAALLDKPVDGEALASAVDAVLEPTAMRKRPTRPAQATPQRPGHP